MAIVLTIWKKGRTLRGSEPEIESWLTHSRNRSLVAFQESTAPTCPFPFSPTFPQRSSPSRVRFAAPDGAPLTALGRSVRPFPPRGKRAGIKLGAPTASRWSAQHSRIRMPPTPLPIRPWGSMLSQLSLGTQFSGAIFLLTSPSIERLRLKSLQLGNGAIVRFWEVGNPPGQLVAKLEDMPTPGSR